ncbi:lysophospholipid acyltransferase family protein [Vandammella animalimorsus]|uniref:1-acyl-sn-glycerol-3-phosphate acyltransferase n=1 Tax=Vandammella animalimorsus TaxID=2029117 RepID=A0A2A2AGJ8_9BURK|nr:lysophospholipid acyltransferase family protein [Vandammella animalimorsus]PAT36936.1 1-acyl-sn-glycerol-3-phosphate acyltransferase [Vandammella animalimorsus]
MSILARFSAAAITGAAKALTGARSLWLGCAPVPQQRIYYANHTSHSDFVLLWASLPPLLRKRTRPVAGADYWLQGRLRRYIIDRVFHGVLVERNGNGAGHGGNGGHDGHGAAAAPAEAAAAPRPDALQPLKAALEAGDSLILFPEGTRNMGEGLLPFKSGLYHLAQAYPEVEIVPVWLGNLNRVMPKGALIPLPLLCTVHFGAPLQLLPGEEKQDFLLRARQALLHLAGGESADGPRGDGPAPAAEPMPTPAPAPEGGQP